MKQAQCQGLRAWAAGRWAWRASGNGGDVLPRERAAWWWCGVAATVLVGAAAVDSGHAAGDGPAGEVRGRAGETGAIERLARGARGPEIATAQAALAKVRSDVDAWAMPPEARAGEYGPVAGACVTLRLGAVVIGRGAGVVLEPDAAARAKVIHAATAAALRQAVLRLPISRDVLRNEEPAPIGRAVSISLELAGEPTPIVTESLGRLEAVAAPGLSGLAVVSADRTAAVFPAAMMAAGQNADEAARALVLEVTGEADLAVDDLAKVSAARGLKWFAFRVTHVVQRDTAARAVALHRGDVPVSVGGTTTAALRQAADEVARHLVRRVSADEAGRGAAGGGAGDGPGLDEYEAASGRRGRAAPPAEVALTALALRRYTDQTGRAAAEPFVPTHTPAGPRGASEEAWGLLMLRLERGGAAGETPAWDDPLAAALVTLNVLPDGGFLGRPLAEKCIATVRGSFDAAAGFRAGVPVVARGALAAALVALAGQADATEADRAAATAAVRRGFADTPAGALVTTMPFLGWAELQLARGGGAVPAGAALRQMRERLWANQIGPVEPGDDREDLVGGVLFADGGAVPTWACLRPLAFAATMLGDARLTTAEERAGQTVRLVYAARFVRQLQAGSGAAWLYPDWPAAEGGLRAAPGRHAMPAGASGMGLIMLTELLGSLERAGPGAGGQERAR